jgi:hypothetical protein
MYTAVDAPVGRRYSDYLALQALQAIASSLGLGIGPGRLNFGPARFKRNLFI